MHGRIVRLALLVGMLFPIAAHADFDAAMQAYRAANYAAARVEFERLAGGGDLPSQLMLGSMYFYGRGVTRDDAKAAEWFARGAHSGDPSAQLAYGALFKDGHGVPIDVIEGYMWLTLAADPRNGDVYYNARRIREQLVATMTAEQIGEAERRAKAWQPEAKR